MLNFALPVARPWAGIGLVWLRNAQVWAKSWRTSLVGSVGEPLFYFLGLGVGLGTLIPAVDGQPYLHFVAPGLMLSSVMYSATIEATYCTFTKMEHQRVFESMLLTPLTFSEIVLGEIFWAATKGAIGGLTVLLLLFLCRISPVWPGILGLGLVALTGVVFAAMGMVVTASARAYDSFNYYFTLVISPMFFFSGIFYPVTSMGRWVAAVAWLSPLTHLVRLSRALLTGVPTADWQLDLAWLVVFCTASVWFARDRMVRRFHP